MRSAAGRLSFAASTAIPAATVSIAAAPISADVAAAAVTASTD